VISTTTVEVMGLLSNPSFGEELRELIRSFNIVTERHE
jgi:hypothetical protein